MKTETFLKDYQFALEKRLTETHKQQLKQSREKGEEDGKRNLPSVDDDFTTPVEFELRSKYQTEIDGLFQYGQQVLNDLHENELKAVHQQLHELNPQRIEDLLAEEKINHEQQIEQLTTNHLDAVKDIENSPHYQMEKKKFEKVKTRWEHIASKHKREELNIQFKPYWAYILLLFGIGIAEFPLNNQVFVSFRETPLLTLIMAGVLVIALPFLAHAAGKVLKQAGEQKIYPFIFIILLATVVTISYFTAMLRTNYLEELGVPAEQLVLDQWTFFTIGIILFLVGTVASFFAHDSSNEFAEVYKKYHTEEEKFLLVQTEVNNKRTAEKDMFDSEKKRIQKEYAEKTGELKNKLQHLELKKTAASGDYKKVLAFCQGMERKINNQFKEALYNYRDTNLTFRNNHKQPRAWAITVPDLKVHFNGLNFNLTEIK